MARLITVLALVCGSVWFANRAIDGVTSAHAEHTARLESGIGHSARGM